MFIMHVQKGNQQKIRQTLAQKYPVIFKNNMRITLIPFPGVTVHNTALLQCSRALGVGNLGFWSDRTEPLHYCVNFIFGSLLVAQSSVGICNSPPSLVLWRLNASVGRPRPLFLAARTRHPGQPCLKQLCCEPAVFAHAHC